MGLMQSGGVDVSGFNRERIIWGEAFSKSFQEDYSSNGQDIFALPIASLVACKRVSEVW